MTGDSSSHGASSGRETTALVMAVGLVLRDNEASPLGGPVSLANGPGRRPGGARKGCFRPEGRLISGRAMHGEGGRGETRRLITGARPLCCAHPPIEGDDMSITKYEFRPAVTR